MAALKFARYFAFGFIQVKSKERGRRWCGIETIDATGGAALVEGDCYRAGFPPSQLSRINWKSSISSSFRGAAFRGIAAAQLSLCFKVAIDQSFRPEAHESPKLGRTQPSGLSVRFLSLCGFPRSMKEK